MPVLKNPDIYLAECLGGLHFGRLFLQTRLASAKLDGPFVYSTFAANCLPIYTWIYQKGTRACPTISPDPDFRPSPGPLFVEDLTARVVRAQPPASGLLAGIKLNSLVSNLGGECQIEILQFRQGGGERWGRYFPGGLTSS